MITSHRVHYYTVPGACSGEEEAGQHDGVPAGQLTDHQYEALSHHVRTQGQQSDEDKDKSATPLAVMN